MFKLSFQVDGETKLVSLSGHEMRIGRASDNDIVLPDYSVSRRHAVLRREGEMWVIYDLHSTNGVLLNRVSAEQAPIDAGDIVKIGVFELEVQAEGLPTTSTLPAPEAFPGRPEPQVASSNAAIGNATIIRPISELADYASGALGRGSFIRQTKRKALDEAYASQVFGFMTRLAKLLTEAGSTDDVLARVMEIAFEALPVDRGFILLLDRESGELGCELSRVGGQLEMRPSSEVPVSQTMLQAVMDERIALLTYDALSDQRLAGTESVRIHQIRAAMCAPLWSGERIIGVVQVDSPHHAGSFTEQDVDLLAALANYCAVAVERLQNAAEAEQERRLRSRLERYHSPAVIEEVMRREAPGPEGGLRQLERAEVTVLFGDLVGFTAFSEKAQPEEVAELMETYFTYAVEAIFSAGGTLDKFIGDCVMAFFGAPMAQDDHAERAVRAAIRMQDSLDLWNESRRSLQLPPIRIRVGINSGPVVVGDIGSKKRVDYTVLGNTVNVAARLEQAASGPGEIVVGAATRRLLPEQVPVETLGELQLKGLSQPIEAFRILRRSARREVEPA